MNRLTIRKSDGAWDVPLRVDDDGAYIPSQEIIDRLAAYEDSGLDPEEVRGIKTAYDEVQIPYEVVATGADAARVIRLLDAEDEGRLLVLPCKVGGKVFRASCSSWDCVTEIKINRRGYHFKCWWGWFHKKDIGKTVFLTREDAEKALEGMDNDER